MFLVDGLERGRWMLATKTHHAMVDGVGSIDVGHILLDGEPEPTGRPAPQTPASNGPGGDGRPLSCWLSPAIAAARAAIGTTRHPGRIARAGKAAAAMSEVIWEDEIQAARPSTLNVPIGTTRRFASVALDLDDAKTIKGALGGTVNDVILAVATGALRRLLAQRGEMLDHPLRATVPVNLSGEDHGSLGNQVTSLFVDLPIAEPDPRRRYDQTRVGARLRQILPLVPPAANHALGIAIVSYDGTLFFGINADHAATPDLDGFTDALREECVALLALTA
jgi:diacylglycerol O-acyltransferase